MIIKNFSTADNVNGSPELSNQNASGVINQYKDIIRDQDYKMQSLRSTLKQQEEEIEMMKRQFAELQQMNMQLHDQNILVKAQLAAATSSTSNAANHNHKDSNADDSAIQIRFYQAETCRLQEEVTNLNEKLSEALDMTEKSLNLTEISKIRKDQEDLLELLTDQVGFCATSNLRAIQIFLSFAGDEDQEV